MKLVSILTFGVFLVTRCLQIDWLLCMLAQYHCETLSRPVTFDSALMEKEYKISGRPSSHAGIIISLLEIF